MAPLGLPPDLNARILANLVNSSAELITKVDQLSTAPRGAPSEARYQNALKTLPWFPGQHPQVKKGICSEAVHNLEYQCDKWLSRYELFVNTHNLDVTQNRRAFFDRLTGTALEFMRPQQPTPRTVPELIGILRLRFQRPRTWDEINKEITSFERKRFEDIPTYIDRFRELLLEMRCVDHFFSQECATNRCWQQFLSYCAEPDLREKLRSNGLMNPIHQASAIAFAQRYYDERGLAPWATGYEAKKRASKAKGSVNNIELEEDQPEELLVNAVKTSKCTSCGRPGHDARSCLTSASSKLVNIQPFKAESTKKEAKKDEKKCTFCNKKGHLQVECYTFARAVREFNEAQASRQGAPGNTSTPAHNRGNSRGRGGRGNRGGRGRGRGGSGRTVNMVEVDANPSEGGGPPPSHPATTGNGAEN